MSIKTAVITSTLVVLVLAGSSVAFAQTEAVSRHAHAIEKLDPLETDEASSLTATVQLVGAYKAVYDLYDGQVADPAVLNEFVTKEAALRARGQALDGPFDVSVRRSEEHGSGWFWDVNKRSDVVDARITELKTHRFIDVKAEHVTLNKLVAAADNSHEEWAQTHPAQP